MKIVIDAGHGYSTAGKRSPDGLQEYEINRSIASYARQFLESYQNIRIIFTHSDKQDVPLQTRVKTANSLQADCFVSIHSNAAGHGTEWHSASGIETYIYNSASQKSRSLADKVQQNLIIATGLKNRGVKTADFYVLRETKMPAILVECGFMTNSVEVKLLKSETYRKACGEAIAKAIAAEYHLQKKLIPLVTTPTIGSYKVQIGAFKSKQLADALAQTLKKQGYEPYIIFEKQ
ncbi:N-acetylmuramoyl-L-alanine amidase [Bacillus massiliigorillae]|uniref:N-acetylmuramoyl-L-alanine amidase n=1 Tax=Bacillus massiliigorillae TaxID=1243664 RepID=UPI0003A124AC|nr:N-acetylmuramoyl-L-alanine amidase [Bacillus massiliigorillae]